MIPDVICFPSAQEALVVAFTLVLNPVMFIVLNPAKGLIDFVSANFETWLFCTVIKM